MKKTVFSCQCDLIQYLNNQRFTKECIIIFIFICDPNIVIFFICHTPHLSTGIYRDKVKVHIRFNIFLFSICVALIHGYTEFVYNGTNKFTKQVDQSLMNFYLIDGFMCILSKYAAFPNHFLISNGIYFAKQNSNMSHMQSNITKYNIFIP